MLALHPTAAGQKSQQEDFVSRSVSSLETSSEGPEESLAFVENYIRKNGPYDGSEFAYPNPNSWLRCELVTDAIV